MDSSLLPQKSKTRYLDTTHTSISEICKQDIRRLPFTFMHGCPVGSSSPNKVEANKETEAEEVKCKRKAINERSWVWNHFTKFKTDDGVSKARCNYCPTVYNYKHDSSLNGTSTLKDHCRSKNNPFKKEPGPKQGQLSFQPISIEGKEATLSTWSYCYDTVRKSLAYMVIVDELPFKFVGGQGFRFFCLQMQPRFNIPSRTTVARDRYQIFVDERLTLMSFLKNSCRKVCLTTGTWTSLQKINYMCLTAHFIDNDWNLNKRIINFCPISSHKGEAIGKAIEKCLLSWGVENVMTLSVDNASSNDLAVAYVKRKIVNWKGAVLNGEFLHVRCTAHIMNLVVNDGLKLASMSVNCVRNALRFIRQSPSRIEKFKKCIEEEKIESKSLLCLDVPTRWNSTYFMLETALKFQSAFDRYGECDPRYIFDLEEGQGKPTDEDWEKVRDLTQMLESFYHLTLHVSGSVYVTANVLFQEVSDVNCHLKDWIDSDNFELSAMALKMKAKYDKYWGDPKKINVLIFIAAMLDPRNKMEYVEFAISEMYKPDVSVVLIKKFKKAIFDMFDEYKKLSDQSSGGPSVTCGLSPAPNVPDLDVEQKTKPTSDSWLMQRFKKQKARKVVAEQRSELDKYLEEECENGGDKFNILSWWKYNAVRYAVLSLIARDVLATPVSTVASESAFSTGGRVLDSFRSLYLRKLLKHLFAYKIGYELSISS